MSYNCLIVDDEPLARKVIREYLEKIDSSIKITESADPVDAQKMISENNYNIIYLDINMPMMTGLELANSISTDALIIFSTAYAEHAVSAFELAAFDYLVKPISFSRFQKSFNRALQVLESAITSEASWMMIKEGKRMYKVPYAEVLYLQAYGDYVKIFTKVKTYLMKARLTNLGESLTTNFVRSHRSYIVSIDKITYLEGNHVVIHEEKIPISEGYREALIQRL